MADTMNAGDLIRMPSISAELKKTETELTEPGGAKARAWIGWSSFFFALLQSVCTFFGAVDGLRLAIGLGALAVSASVDAAIDSFHGVRLHLPMIVLATAGAVLNLIVLWQVRRLRARPAAQWRVRPPSPKKIRMERLQFVLAIMTLVLVVAEETLHYQGHGRF
jgi:hypothetical protein